MKNKALINQFEIKGKFSQTDISKLTGIDKSTVSLHLSGSRQISIRHAEKYAKILNVPLHLVLEDKIAEYPITHYINEKKIIIKKSEDIFDVLQSLNELIALKNCFSITNLKDKKSYIYST